MRIVSWIVVVGALAWLLYAQLNHHFESEALEGIAGETVSGTFTRDLPRPVDGSAGIAYANLFPKLEAAEAVDDRDRIDVVALVRQVEAAMATVQEGRGGGAADVVGVIFEFAPGSRGTVRAGEGPESRVFQADEQGRVRLALTPELLAANPTLAFSPMPRRVVPLVVSETTGSGRGAG